MDFSFSFSFAPLSAALSAPLTVGRGAEFAGLCACEEPSKGFAFPHAEVGGAADELGGCAADEGEDEEGAGVGAAGEGEEAEDGEAAAACFSSCGFVSHC